MRWAGYQRVRFLQAFPLADGVRPIVGVRGKTRGHRL